jgi:hypothetical protein
MNTNDQIRELRILLADCAITLTRFRYLVICNDFDTTPQPPFDGSEADAAAQLINRCRKAQKEL